MANQIQTVKEWEKKSYNYFLSVMKKNQVIRHCFMDARMALESLIMNLYKEKFNKDSTDLISAIDGLNNLRMIPNEGLFHTMHFIRKIGNGQVHPRDEYNVELLNTIRLGLLSIFKWHFIQNRNYRSYRTEIDEFYRKTSEIKENPLWKVLRIEKYSESTIGNIAKAKPYKKENIKLETTRRPIFGVFVIDMSGSMVEYKDDAIFAHKEAIEALRGSADCINKSLYLTQYVFNENVHPPLNQLAIIRNNGNDKIILLNKENYTPNGLTALYDTLEEALNYIYNEMSSVRMADSKKPQISIAIITDGEDNKSKSATPEIIKNLMLDLLENGYHYSSVVIGLTDPETFSKARLEEMRKSLGFSESISIDCADSDIALRRKKIREAFKLGSLKLVGK